MWLVRDYFLFTALILFARHELILFLIFFPNANIYIYRRVNYYKKREKYSKRKHLSLGLISLSVHHQIIIIFVINIYNIRVDYIM